MEPEIINPETQKLSRAEINRLNAQKSTGPKTEEGKRKSSLNALRHGLTAQTVLLPNEDAEAYQRLVDDFHQDLQPKGMLERQMAQSIAEDAWRMNRARVLENNLFALGLREQAESLADENPSVQAALAMAEALREQTRALATISMHSQRVARQFSATVKQLREIQEERRDHEDYQMRQAANLLALHEAEQQRREPGEPEELYNPADDGFDFTHDEVYTYLELDERKGYALLFLYNGKLPKKAA